jgi:hypothetical protein
MRQFIDIVANTTQGQQILSERARASAVWVKEVPPEYKKLRLIGRGMTSLVYEKDPETVLIFTRDYMKAEYMRDCDIAVVLRSYESNMHPEQEMHELPIYILEMPKLEKISGKNIGLVRRACKEVSEIIDNIKAKYTRLSPAQAHEFSMQEASAHFSEDENHILHDFWRFLVNYDPRQYHVDVGQRNFLQKATGEIVVTDPVVASEIMTILDDARGRRWSHKEY